MTNLKEGCHWSYTPRNNIKYIGTEQSILAILRVITVADAQQSGSRAWHCALRRTMDTSHENGIQAAGTASIHTEEYVSIDCIFQSCHRKTHSLQLFVCSRISFRSHPVYTKRAGSRRLPRQRRHLRRPSTRTRHWRVYPLVHATV